MVMMLWPEVMVVRLGTVEVLVPEGVVEAMIGLDCQRMGFKIRV